MKKYIRDNFLFQTERDKGKKINTQILDFEFYNLSQYIDSVIIYLNTIEGGNFVGKQGYNNFLFKNKGNVVLLEPIENVSLQYTFSNYENSFFIYNSNYQPNLYAFSVLDNNKILKYYNNNFLFDIIRTEDFTINSIVGSQKIKTNSIDVSKIKNFLQFFTNQTKFLYRDSQIQKIISSNGSLVGVALENIIDTNSSFFLSKQKFIDYLDVTTAVGAWFDYIKKNKFSVQKKIESYITTTATTDALFKKMQFGVNFLLGNRGCPVNTISSKSVTDITMIYEGTTGLPEPLGGTKGYVVHGTYKDANSEIKWRNDAQPINSLFWYFHKMLWGEKQITKRLFHHNYSFGLTYNVVNQLWYYIALSPTVYDSYQLVIKSTPTPFNYQIRHNYHIADGCFEPRHFCNNSISLNSIAKNNNAKIPLSKFNRAFLTRLGL